MNKTFTSPTLDDVAAEAGVSSATVSRAINSPTRVAERTQNRIQAAIEKLGYTPNFGGRALATNRTNIVGAVIPTMSNAVFAGGLQAFQEELARAKVTLLISSSNYDSAQELEQIKTLLSHGVDGLLLVGSDRPQATDEFLRARKIPTLNVWNYRKNPDQLYVGFDNYAAGAELAMLVMEHNHKNIAIVSGLLDGNDRARDRLEGMKSVIESPGMEANLVTVHETKYSFDHAAEAFDHVMAHIPRPTAIMAGNDVLAAGMIARAKSLGLSVPEDVSITGFDDIALAQFVDPGLTTVRVPQQLMGKRAAEELLREIRERGTGQSQQLATHVVRRGSLGLARA